MNKSDAASMKRLKTQQLVRLEASDSCLPVDVVSPVHIIINASKDDALLMTDMAKEFGSLAKQVAGLGLVLTDRHLAVDRLEVLHPIFDGHPFIHPSGLADLCFALLPGLQSVHLGSDSWIVGLDGALTHSLGVPKAEVSVILSPGCSASLEAKSQLGWGLPTPKDLPLPEHEAGAGVEARAGAPLAGPGPREHANSYGWGMRLLESIRLESGCTSGSDFATPTVPLCSSHLSDISLSMPALVKFHASGLFSHLDDLSALGSLVGLRELSLQSRTHSDHSRRGPSTGPLLRLSTLPGRLETLHLEGFELVGSFRSLGVQQGGGNEMGQDQGQDPHIGPTPDPPALRTLSLTGCSGASLSTAFRSCTRLQCLFYEPLALQGERFWSQKQPCLMPHLESVELWCVNLATLTANLPLALSFVWASTPSLRKMVVSTGSDLLPHSLFHSPAQLNALASDRLHALLVSPSSSRAVTLPAAVLQAALCLTCEAVRGGHYRLVIPIGEGAVTDAGRMASEEPLQQGGALDSVQRLCGEGDWPGWDDVEQGFEIIDLDDGCELPNFGEHVEAGEREDDVDSLSRMIQHERLDLDLEDFDSPNFFGKLGGISTLDSERAREESDRAVDAMAKKGEDGDGGSAEEAARSQGGSQLLNGSPQGLSDMNFSQGMLSQIKNNSTDSMADGTGSQASPIQGETCIRVDEEMLEASSSEDVDVLDLEAVGFVDCLFSDGTDSSSVCLQSPGSPKPKRAAQVTQDKAGSNINGSGPNLRCIQIVLPKGADAAKPGMGAKPVLAAKPGVEATCNRNAAGDADDLGEPTDLVQLMLDQYVGADAEEELVHHLLHE